MKTLVTGNNRQEPSPASPASAKETERLARIERLLGDVPKVSTAARMFDEQAEREASEAASKAHSNRKGFLGLPKPGDHAEVHVIANPSASEATRRY